MLKEGGGLASAKSGKGGGSGGSSEQLEGIAILL